MEDYRYKIGQKVRVKHILVDRDYYMRSGPAANRRISASGFHASHSGEILTIKQARNAYHMEEFPDVFWTDEMLEPASPFSCRSLL